MVESNTGEYLSLFISNILFLMALPFFIVYTDKPQIVLMRETDVSSLKKSVMPQSNKLSISPRQIQNQSNILGRTVEPESRIPIKTVCELIT